MDLTHYAYARGYYHGHENQEKQSQFQHSDLLERAYQAGYLQGAQDLHQEIRFYQGVHL